MNGTTFVVLAIAALLTSIVSGILGMAGGMMLLAVMLSFMTHAEAIPTHAAVQMASNGTRALAFLPHVDGSAFGRFLLGVLPGGTIGVLLLWWLGELGRGEPYLKCLVGAYILLASWISVPKPDHTNRGTWWDFPLLGLVAGTAALTVGAVGPLIAPLFARRDFVKERLIATKAVCQLATHVVKIPAFIFVRDIPVGKLGLLALVMIAMVIPGTLIGKRILTGITPQAFRIAFRVALTVAGLKVLIIDGLWPIVFGG